jgi:transketolase
MSYENILENLIKSDERFIILTAENRAAIRNLPSKIGSKFLDTGITEMTLVGMATGLALRGRIPIVHALATFLTMRAFEFIRTDVGISKLPVKLIGYVPGILSEANGPTHQSLEDISLMRGIPGMKIFCPADEEDMLICIEKILNSPSPYYIRYNNRKPVYKHSEKFSEGKAEVIYECGDINLITYGTLFPEALKTCELLKCKGLDTGLVNLRTLKPVDEEAILDCLKNGYLTVTIEDHFLSGGLYSIVSEIATKNNILNNILPFAFADKWFKPAMLNDVINYEKLNPDLILYKILNEISKILW